MTATDREVIEHAAALLDGLSLDLRMSNTLPPDHQDWNGETEAEREYRDIRQTVDQLYALSDRMQRPDPLSQALNEGDGTYKP